MTKSVKFYNLSISRSFDFNIKIFRKQVTQNTSKFYIQSNNKNESEN